MGPVKGNKTNLQALLSLARDLLIFPAGKKLRALSVSSHYWQRSKSGNFPKCSPSS